MRKDKPEQCILHLLNKLYTVGLMIHEQAFIYVIDTNLPMWYITKSIVTMYCILSAA